MLEAVFTSSVDEIEVSGLTQWDRGQQLNITCPNLPTLFQVHFAFKGGKEALAVTATGTTVVDIPNEVLMQPRDLVAYIYLFNSDGAGETVKTIHLPLTPRAKPEDYTDELTPTQVERIEAMLASIHEDATAKAEQAVDIAEAAAKEVTDATAWAVSHAARHKANGADPLTPSDIGAWAENAPLSVDCNTDINAGNGSVYVRKINANTANSPAKEGVTSFNNGAVITFATNSTYGTQIAVVGGEVFARRQYNGTITPWKKYAASDHTHTAADVGAVAKSGDTMTGDLAVEKALPALSLKNASSGRLAYFNMGGDGYAAWVNRLDTNNQVALYLNKESATLTNCFTLNRKASGTGNSYNILHTGNVVASQTDITAGSSASWQQYLVYE